VTTERLHFLFHVANVEQLEQVVSGGSEKPVAVLIEGELHDGVLVSMAAESIVKIKNGQAQNNGSHSHGG
jgi:hypothetical protein